MTHFLHSEKFQLLHCRQLSRNFLKDLYHHVKAVRMKFETINNICYCRDYKRIVRKVTTSLIIEIIKEDSD